MLPTGDHRGLSFKLRLLKQPSIFRWLETRRRWHYIAEMDHVRVQDIVEFVCEELIDCCSALLVAIIPSWQSTVFLC